MPVTRFDNDDDAYLTWMKAHPHGWVANIHRGKNSNYFVIHHADHGLMHHAAHAVHPNPFTGNDYAKVVSADLVDLCAWRAARGWKVTKRNLCGTCGKDIELPRSTTASSDPEEVASRAAELLKAGTLHRPSGGGSAPRKSKTTAVVYERSPLVRAWILQRAAGRCELCLAAAPFIGRDGLPFLEVHHLTQLADGGLDEVRNCAALCPNCHRHLHLGRGGRKLTARLRARVRTLEDSLPDSVAVGGPNPGAAAVGGV